MTEKEIVQALRCRARHEKATNEGCKKCPYWATENLEEWQKLCGWASCKVYQIISDAADAIERLTSENAALREKVAQWISVKDADRRAPAGQRVIATDGVFVGEAYAQARIRGEDMMITGSGTTRQDTPSCTGCRCRKCRRKEKRNGTID